MYPTREAYRDAWSLAATVDPPIPLNVDIELASLCNLTCPFCFISDGSFDEMIRQKATDGKPKARMMPTELAEIVIDKCVRAGVPAIKMNWRGESTLHPDYHRILAYAARAARRGAARCSCHAFGAHPALHDILVNTNANCGDSAVDGLMCATKVMVSLDSLTPGIYAVMRRGGRLERAKEVIKELVRRRHPNLWVRRVLTKLNAGEPFAQQAKSEFGGSIHVSEHHCFDRNQAERHGEPGCDHDMGLDRTYCTYPSTRIVVSSTGLCYPCCIDLHEEMPVGDIKTQGVRSVWNGEPMRRLRDQLRRGVYASKACVGCESWMSYDSPKRERVQDVEVVA